MENKETVIKFDNVSKVYKLYKSDRARFKGLFNSKVKYKENRAVKNKRKEYKPKGHRKMPLIGMLGSGYEQDGKGAARAL